ncbi:MAG: GGDEF domain-containing protein [Rhodocyclaceae bacterium]|nr:GGDEF domain-containing protein [Rhodocyclaceae bacterium]
MMFGVATSALDSHLGCLIPSANCDASVLMERVRVAEREIQRLRQELAAVTRLVRHDPLTGVLNRRGLDEALDAYVARICRQSSGFSLAFLDIDNFKRLNDNLGHQAGDAVLVNMAQDIQSALRPDDSLARWGGEEFVVLLDGADLAASLGVMTRIQDSVRSVRHCFMGSWPRACRPGDDVGNALKQADQLMYEAKRGGKDRVLASLVQPVAR